MWLLKIPLFIFLATSTLFFLDYVFVELFIFEALVTNKNYNRYYNESCSKNCSNNNSNNNSITTFYHY